MPAREYSIRSEFEIVVTLPTLDRVLAVPRCCCRATAGGRPSIESTWGTPACSNSRRAYGATDSRYRRWASAKIVPNASDDLPEPETPVNTTSASRGTSTSTSFRLCSRAPRTRTNRSRDGIAGGGSGWGGPGDMRAAS